MTECVFCQIVSGKAPHRRLHDDHHAQAFFPLDPLAAGHTLVIPKKHAADLWTISSDDACHVMKTALQVAQVIGDVVHPDGMTLVQNSRHAGGQDVFHFHMHLVPRWEGDAIGPLYPRSKSRPQVDEAELEMVHRAMLEKSSLNHLP